MEWKAKWIWHDGESSPRNEWRCFRRSFDVPDGGWQAARLSIAADSRYVLYVNGVRVGRGPARSWPSETSYDVYDIGRHLKRGKQNTIAVMVMHFGLSTFYYLRGRGGLLAQLDVTERDRTVRTIGTDGDWKTELHLGHDPRGSRMSTQNAFAERIDARRWDDAWTSADYDDSAWARASVIGSVGMEPWTKLVPRDIPFLTDEPVYPACVESLSRVKPISWSAYVDIRNQMSAGSEDHMNTVWYTGYLGTVIRVAERTKAVLGFTNTAVFGPLALKGEIVDKSRFYGEAPQKYVEVELQAGDNLVWMDITGKDHSVGFYMGVDCSLPFEVVSPLVAGEDDSAFVTVGPFEHGVVAERPISWKIESDHPDYLRAARLAAKEQLAGLGDWVRPVPKRLVDEKNVFTLSVWKKECDPQPIPAEVQNLVKPNIEAAPIPLFEGADTEMILDFGKMTSGFLEFEVEAPAGTVIDLYGFEFMHDGWRQETYRLNNTLRYVCRDGDQTYTSAVRRGLRYLMVTVRGASGPVRIRSVRTLQSLYPVADVGRFQCSDAGLNRIWEMSRHTVRLCMEDTFVDCPTYEQTFWVGDARNEALVGYYLFDAEELVRHCLKLVPGSREQTPYYASQVPSGWASVIPNWTFFWVTACKEYYKRTADASFVREIWPDIRFTLEHYLTNLNAGGLFEFTGWNLLDWAKIDQPNEGVVAHQNMFFVKALRDAAELATIAEDHTEADRYEASAGKLKEAVNKHLWSEERGAYLDCIHADGRRSNVFSMQTQVSAYLCGITDDEPEREQRLRSYLHEPPTGFVQIGSPFMSFFYYEALARIGGYQRMLDDIRSAYGQMVDYDATACWEMFPESTNRDNPKFLTRSHCHAWSAAPGYFLGASILGVRSVSPGWREIIVEPQPCDLSWARGSVPLPDGDRIDVSWRVDGPGRIRIRTEAHASRRIEVRIPEGYEGTIERIER